jgi:hypothetical protein
MWWKNISCAHIAVHFDDLQPILRNLSIFCTFSAQDFLKFDKVDKSCKSGGPFLYSKNWYFQKFKKYNYLKGHSYTLMGPYFNSAKLN